MASLTTFRMPSAVHSVKEERGGFSISPIGSGNEAIESFQGLAKVAATYDGTDYIPRVHYSDGVIDLVFFEQCVP